MKERARQGAPEWSAVVADAQTAGRGRHGRAWHSAPGNLHMSVLLRPEGEASRAGLIPLAAGLAVAEALAAEGRDPRLKWPNDVWIGERKVAGILVESASTGARLETAVVGIGVNVASVPKDLPAEVRAQVACLADSGPAPDVLALAAAVLARMRVWYHPAADGAALVAAWRARALPWWGRTVEATSGGEVVRGRAVDVDRSGALILRRDDGTTTLLHAGEVREVRPGR